jgi:hypothetical protein
MPTTVAPLTTFGLVDLDGSACAARWERDLAVGIKDAFIGARFLPGFGPESPLEHTQEGLTGPGADSYLHALAEAADGRVLGASFRVPVVCPEGTVDAAADPGWFFVAHDLPLALKVEIVDAVVVRSHQLMKGAGFARVVTNMGTKDGAMVLRRRHGYVHAPLPDQDNRWIREL